MNLFLLLACASGPAPEVPPEPAAQLSSERDRPFVGAARWELEGRVLTLAAGTLYADGAAILAHVYDDPVGIDDALYVPADPGEGDGGIYVVRVREGAVTVVPLVTSGRPDRLALSPDGSAVAYVGGHTGITSVWALPTRGGVPRQLTNVGVQATPGEAPLGFVPLPERGPVRFDGASVVWTAEGTERRATWR
ncbi:MAG: hypothetical protein Q8P18_18865 [Pseudomonadota bacterium]|nr:hypothetical protein [Pseudomonadota bacterium]